MTGRARSPRRLLVAAVILSPGVVVGGCALLGGATPLERASQEAATWPIVTYLHYYEANIADDEELYVYLRRDASVDEVKRLWCELLMPAGADYTNTALMDEDELVVPLPACPGPSPRAADA